MSNNAQDLVSLVFQSTTEEKKPISFNLTKLDLSVGFNQSLLIHLPNTISQRKKVQTLSTCGTNINLCGSQKAPRKEATAPTLTFYEWCSHPTLVRSVSCWSNIRFHNGLQLHYAGNLKCLYSCYNWQTWGNSVSIVTQIRNTCLFFKASQTKWKQFKRQLLQVQMQSSVRDLSTTLTSEQPPHLINCEEESSVGHVW